ncbi:MAG TPA: MMPL family transporter, partial [Pseudomonadales bacterium]|nr:MMPL family transporter [Pseudomonadales bacterium]
GLVKGEIDIAAATTFSISLGIAVDDTIHFVTHYLQYRRQGLSPERAIELIFEQTGISMILTTVILVIGLVILMYSHFSPNQTMGMLTAIILSFALVFELFFMPGLLVQLDGWLSRRAAARAPDLIRESSHS